VPSRVTGYETSDQYRMYNIDLKQEDVTFKT